MKSANTKMKYIILGNGGRLKSIVIYCKIPSINPPIIPAINPFVAPFLYPVFTRYPTIIPGIKYL